MSTTQNGTTETYNPDETFIGRSLIRQTAKLIEDDPDQDLTLEADVDSLSVDDQFAAMVMAAAALNAKYDSGFWVSTHYMTNEPESVAEKNGYNVEEFKDELNSPAEIEDITLPGIEQYANEVIHKNNPNRTNQIKDNLHHLKSVLDATYIESHGIETKQEKTEFLELVLDIVKKNANFVVDDNMNACYATADDITDDKKELLAKICAYVVGHTGCRVGLQNDMIVFVDDVRMYANRHDIEPQEFMEQSWSNKEAEIQLKGDNLST